MYNSSIKGQGTKIRFSDHKEIPGKIFFNDLSKRYFVESFIRADVIFSEIAWPYGYKLFNENAENIPGEYADYMRNINRLIGELKIPSFIVCGKLAARYFPYAEQREIKINLSGTNMDGCILYVWNYSKPTPNGTNDLIDQLSKEFKCCLDFSCGYGEHLLKFQDFVGCDIDRDCLTYLSILMEERNNAKTEDRN